MQTIFTYDQLTIHERLNFKGYIEVVGKYYGSWPGKNHDLLRWVIGQAHVDVGRSKRYTIAHRSRGQLILQ